MKRREAAGAALALSAAAGLLFGSRRAQAQGRPFRLGILGLGVPEGSTAILQAFDQGLRENGLIEGRNLETKARWAGNSLDALPAMAAELAAHPVDAILAGNNNVIAAAQAVTSTIPIVMVLAVDPVRNGFIDSFARPGRNITGLTNDLGFGIHGKMLELLKQLAPAASVIGILVQQGVGIDRVALDAAAQQLNLQLRHSLEVRRPEDVALAIEALKGAGSQALYVLGGGIIFQNRQSVIDLSLRHRLPGMFFAAEYPRAGGLASYGIDLRAQYRRAAWYVGRLLNGAKAAELPVEQPARFETVINLRTARALGLVVPRNLLLRADEVIE